MEPATAEQGHWRSIAQDVHVRRYAELDQTLGLVIGAQRCLVIDTGRDETHGAELAGAVRTLTHLPPTLVFTHAHFDHFLGTAAFGRCPIWAHERCARAISASADSQRSQWAAHYRQTGKHGFAEAVQAARALPPTDLITDEASIDLGGRSVTLFHPGRAHTDHDIAVHVPDTHVAFAGDLVEQGADPSVGADAYPAEWPAALDVLLATGATTFVPGHGEPVGRAFVEQQREELRARAGH